MSQTPSALLHRAIAEAASFAVAAVGEDRIPVNVDVSPSSRWDPILLSIIQPATYPQSSSQFTAAGSLSPSIQIETPTYNSKRGHHKSAVQQPKRSSQHIGYNQTVKPDLNENHHHDQSSKVRDSFFRQHRQRSEWRGQRVEYAQHTEAAHTRQLDQARRELQV